MSKNMEKDDKMKKFRIRLLAAVVTSSMIVTPVMAAPSVDQLKESKAAAQSEVNSLQEQLKKVIQELNQIEEDLVAKGEEVIKTTEDLKVAEETEKKQYADMKLRIKFMYEEGDTSMFETLVSSENFSDLVNKAEYVQNVHTYDRDKLQEYVETKEKVATLKASLEAEQKELETKEQEFSEKEESLNDMLESKEAEVANLDAELQAAVEAAAREAAAKAERERQEKEAQAAQNNNNSNKNNNSNNNSNSSSNNSGSNNSSSNSGSGSSGSSNPTPSYVPGSTVSRAYASLGKPYRSGAVGPDAFDCSGLVGFCLTGKYKRVYVSGSFLGMPRVDNPQPGDICVKPGHVGVYVGGGQMIHAPRTGDVVKVAAVQKGMWYVRP